MDFNFLKPGKIITFNKVSTSIKPYILENKLIKRMDRILNLNSSNNFMVSQRELKQAIKNRILDLTYEQLAELNTLEDSVVYEFVVNKAPSKYLNYIK